MAVYDFFLSRNNGPTVSTYVGHSGRLFYDPAERVLRISDGSTIGGEIFNGVVTVSNTEPTLNFQGQIWLNPENYALTVYHNGNFIPTIDIATETTIGGVKLGPGVITNGDGQIIIDPAGLDFSFGDFESTTPAGGAATLSSIGTNQNIDIVSNGTGYINIVGNFHVHKAEGYDPETPDPDGAIFAVKADGQVQMKVPLSDSTTGAFEVVGNDTGLFLSPNQTGVILHVTGNSGLVSRSYFDANANYALLAGRRYNGTQLAPRRVLNNEILLRIVSQAAGSATSNGNATFQTFGPARISFIANEDQTPTAQGGRIAFEVTKNGFVADAVGTNTITAAYIDAQNGLTATEFNGPLTGDVTGNVSGTAGSVAAANVTGTTLASNVVTSSLTTVGTLGSLTVTNSSSAKHHTTTAVEIGTTAANFNLDLSAGELQHVTVTGDVTITPQNPVAGRTTRLIITFSGNRTVTHGIAAAMTTTKSATIASNNQIRVLEYYQLGSTLATDVYLNVN